MSSTRQTIISYLQHRGVASVHQLAQALKLTPANIRHHLSILISEGAVITLPGKLASPKGRPANLYTLSSRLTSHNFDQLSDALLSEWLSPLHPAEIEASLHSLASRMVQSAPSPKTHLSQRLVYAVSFLNERSYHASWEARREAPYIKLGHCPYASILPRHPELCRMDAFLLQALLHIPVDLVARLVKDPAGNTHCLFKLNPLAS